MEVELLRHNRVDLALHRLRDGRGRPLLLLHGLGGRSESTLPRWADPWPGPVVALDFTGHGESTVPTGGGYTAEILLADADTALAHLGPLTVVGHGLGGYVALQLAGARATDVLGAVVCDGPGLAGGATTPTSQSYFSLPPSSGVPDPYALLELGHDVRPPDYAASFVRLAVAGSRLDEPISVAAKFHPPWLQAVIAEPGVARRRLTDALAVYTAV
jgi:pimeloyl-ACP methyl ester carboxylesterase